MIASNSEPGVYILMNENTKMVYVGKSTTNCGRRIQQHFSNLRKGNHPIERLQRDFDSGDKINVEIIYKMPKRRYCVSKVISDFILSDVEWVCWKIYSEHYTVYNKAIPTQRMEKLSISDYELLSSNS